MSYYLYVDGESHYYGVKSCWKRLHAGCDIDTIRRNGLNDTSRPKIHNEAHFIWHDWFVMYYEQHLVEPIYKPHLIALAKRRIYVTSMMGDSDKTHEASKYIKDAGFEPLVIVEDKHSRSSREGALATDGLLMKPKGVDIALAVRVMEDATRDLFDTCLLAVSDADYMPLIKAVRRMGKEVHVFGFRADFTKRQPEFDYVPDACYDLERVLKEQFAAVPQ